MPGARVMGMIVSPQAIDVGRCEVFMAFERSPTMGISKIATLHQWNWNLKASLTQIISAAGDLNFRLSHISPRNSAYSNSTCAMALACSLGMGCLRLRSPLSTSAAAREDALRYRHPPCASVPPSPPLPYYCYCCCCSAGPLRKEEE